MAKFRIIKAARLNKAVYKPGDTIEGEAKEGTVRSLALLGCLEGVPSWVKAPKAKAPSAPVP